MYKIVYTNRMKKDVRLMKKRGKDIGKLIKILSLLANGCPLPVQHKDHPLSGNLRDFRECHMARYYPSCFWLCLCAGRQNQKLSGQQS